MLTFYVDTAEAAWILDVSPRTVQRMASDGRLCVSYSVEYGAVREFRFVRTEVGTLAEVMGCGEKCIKCGCQERTHPIETCNDFLGSWQPPPTSRYRAVLDGDE